MSVVRATRIYALVKQEGAHAPIFRILKTEIRVISRRKGSSGHVSSRHLRSGAARLRVRSFSAINYFIAAAIPSDSPVAESPGLSSTKTL
ncbi:hypothetical protein TcasGA2_TC032027 [Tribolium castaneum]|uniref:Uncharacterized protein n=1 Tax=Tribolium castaneum TaxID=7070 RepID=A0A139WN79_TRICA|nr:hypothetical protein TcasGA2_TC032027 [Tribolium castaneum]